MKTAQWIAASCLFLTLALPASAAEADRVPKYLSVQGVLRDSNGVPIPDANASVFFGLYTAQTGGSTIRTEEKSVALQGGVFSTTLGEFEPAQWTSMLTSNQLWLETHVVGQSVNARVQLVTVPYAATAQRAELADDCTEAANCLALSGPATDLDCHVTPCVQGGAGGDIASGTIQTANLADGSVTTDTILNQTIGFVDLAPSCTAGQVIKSNGTGWYCGTDEMGTGTVYRVETSGGLTGGPITASGTIAIGDGLVTNTKLEHSSIQITTPSGSPLSLSSTTIALGGSTILSLGVVQPINGGTGTLLNTAGTGNATNNVCSNGQTLKWNAAQTRWQCGSDLANAGTVKSLTANLPLVASPATITDTGSIGFQSGYIVPVANGGTGRDSLDSGKVYKGAGTAQMVASVISENASGNVSINSTTYPARLNVQGLQSSQTLALLMGTSNAYLHFGSPTGTDKISIGTASTEGIHFYKSPAGTGLYDNPADGSIQIYPDTGRLYIRGPLEALSIRAKPEVRTITGATTPSNACGGGTDCAFVFTDASPDSGPFVLEITSASPAMVARFRCHGPTGAGGFCEADVHQSTADRAIYGYKLGAGADFAVFLKAGVTYKYRTPYHRVNHTSTVVSTTYGRTPSATPDSYLVENGRRMDNTALAVSYNGSSCMLKADSSAVETGATVMARGGVVARGTMATPTGYSWNTIGSSNAVATINANGDDAVGAGIAIGSDGGFFTGSGTLGSRWIVFAGSNGIDMGGKPLINRGCPSGFSVKGATCIANAKLGSAYTLSEAAYQCGNSYGTYGGHLCSNGEIRDAVWANGGVATGWADSWIADGIDTTNGLYVLSGGSTSNPLASLAYSSASKGAICCLAR